MAAPRNRKPKANKVPQTAEEKSARAALLDANKIGLEASQVRAATQSKRAYRPRSLRSGGTELSRYNLGKFSDDPFPSLGGTTGGGGNPGGAPSAPKSGGARRRPKPKKPLRGPSRGGRGGDRPGADLNRGASKPKKAVTKPRATDFEARREAEAARQAAKRKAAAEAARKRKAKEQERKRTGGGRGAIVE